MHWLSCSVFFAPYVALTTLRLIAWVGGGYALRYTELERNSLATRWSIGAKVPGAICYQETTHETVGVDAAAVHNSRASPQLRLLAAATLKKAALAAIRAGQATPAPIGTSSGNAFSASSSEGENSDDSTDSSDVNVFQHRE